MNFEKFINRQRAFSLETFGPDYRGVPEHIVEELLEVEAAVTEGEDELAEWVDVILLGIDGAQRCGHLPAEGQAKRRPSAEEICEALLKKLRHNSEVRLWPDWRLSSPDEPIGHVEGGERS